MGIHILAKAPTPGWCNTRLGQSLGQEKAAALQQALIKDVSSLVERQSSAHQLWIGGDARDTIEKNHSSLPSGNLGDALAHASEVGKAFGWDSHLFVGVDSLFALHRYLSGALLELNANQAVLGPTHDGGVYLMGFQPSLLPVVFSDVPWGTAEVFHRLCQNIEKKSVDVSILPIDYDVDDADDFDRFSQEVMDEPTKAPRSFELLSRWKGRSKRIALR